jgi:hypothetical protein
MPGAAPNVVGDSEGQPIRERGSLFDSELWWRDHYHVLENLGYKLRPRYDPNWMPSWKKSGKEFYTAEDGQPTLVSVIHLVLYMLQFVLVAHRDGRNAPPGRKAGDAQNCSCERTAGIGDCPMVFVARTQA